MLIAFEVLSVNQIILVNILHSNFLPLSFQSNTHISVDKTNYNQNIDFYKGFNFYSGLLLKLKQSNRYDNY